MAIVTEIPKWDEERKGSSGTTIGDRLEADNPDGVAQLRRLFEVESEDYGPDAKLHRAAKAAASNAEPKEAPKKAAQASKPEPESVSAPAEAVEPTVAAEPQAAEKIDELLSSVDLENSTQPASASAELAGVALGRTSGRMAIFRPRSERVSRRETTPSEPAPKPQPPVPTVPTPQTPEPPRPIVINEVSTQPEPNEIAIIHEGKKVPVPPKPELPSVNATSTPEEASTPEVPTVEPSAPENTPVKSETTRPGREHHTPTHANEHHVVHNNVQRPSWFKRLKDALFVDKDAQVPLDTNAQPEAPTPAVTEPAEQLSDAKPTVEKSKAVPKAPKASNGVEAGVRTTAEQKQQAWGENLKNPKTARDLEAYKAARPKAPEEDEFIRRSVDKNGRPIFHNQYGVPVSEAEYDKYRYARSGPKTSANEYYDAKRVQGEVDAAHGEALILNDEHDKEASAALKARIEGEKLIGKEPRLRGLMALGQEIEGLARFTGDKQNNVAAVYEAKRQLFNDLLELYRDKGVDARGLDYVLHETIVKIDNPNHKPIAGSVYLNGEKVTVIDYIESPDGKQSAYTVEQADGSIISTFGQDLEFKREYQKAVEAPAEASEELSRFQKMKGWFKEQGALIRQYGGEGWFAGKWHDAADKIINRKTEGLSPEETEVQQRKNRRNFLIGAGVAAGVAVVSAYGVGIATGFAIHDGVSPDAIPQGGGSGVKVDTEGAATAGFDFGSRSSGSASGSESWQQWTADGFDRNTLRVGATDTGFDTGAASGADAGAGTAPDSAPSTPVEPIAPTPEAGADSGINSPFYTIAEGQGGLKLFENLGISETTWNNNAGTLVRLFPNEFKFEDNDVWIRNAGQLSFDARQFIESLRTR